MGAALREHARPERTPRIYVGAGDERLSKIQQKEAIRDLNRIAAERYDFKEANK